MKKDRYNFISFHFTFHFPPLLLYFPEVCCGTMSCAMCHGKRGGDEVLELDPAGLASANVCDVCRPVHRMANDVLRAATAATATASANSQPVPSVAEPIAAPAGASNDEVATLRWQLDHAINEVALLRGMNKKLVVAVTTAALTAYQRTIRQRPSLENVGTNAFAVTVVGLLRDTMDDLLGAAVAAVEGCPRVDAGLGSPGSGVSSLMDLFARVTPLGVDAASSPVHRIANDMLRAATATASANSQPAPSVAEPAPAFAAAPPASLAARTS
jgi:hypothetical protein